MKKNLRRIKIDPEALKEDFVVVSQIAMFHDFAFLPYKKEMDMSDIEFIMDTPFPSDLTEFVYDVGCTVDISLAVTLGLGVIKSLSNGKLYVYHADTIDDDDISYQSKEMLRLGMFYQLMHPEYDDRKLNLILESKGGEYLLSSLILFNTIEPIEMLKEIFAAKKGVGNNVIKFKA